MGVDPETPSRSEVLGLAGPLLGVAAVFAILDRPVAAIGALVVGVVAVNAAAMSPSVPATVRGRRRQMVHGIGTAVAAALGGITYALFFVPMWAFRRLRRAPWQTASGWTDASAGERATTGSNRTFTAAISDDVASSRATTAFAVIGAVVLLLLVDSGAGMTWDRAFPTDPAGQIDGSNRSSSPLAPDPRVNAPAMAGSPWRAAYFRELQSLRSTYWPYALTRPEPTQGRFINLDGWERATWAAPGSPSARPIVWLLGGSAAWGEGQRDDHTIASEVARLAAADELPIDAHNLGQRGWVSYQEVTLYDELLNDPTQPKPDIALFLDGATDVASQAQQLPGGRETEALAVPMHFGIEHADQLSQRSATPTSTPSAVNTNPVRTAWDAYLDHSLLAKAVRGVRGSDTGEASSGRSSAACGQTCPAVGSDQDIRAPTTRKAIPVYREQRSIARDISRRKGVTAHFFWQPVDIDLPEYQEAAEKVGAPTVDLTRVLDGHADDYLDLVHTNEAGARRVAAAIYARVRPDLVRWYREQGHRP